MDLSNPGSWDYWAKQALRGYPKEGLIGYPYNGRDICMEGFGEVVLSAKDHLLGQTQTSAWWIGDTPQEVLSWWKSRQPVGDKAWLQQDGSRLILKDEASGCR